MPRTRRPSQRSESEALSDRRESMCTYGIGGGCPHPTSFVPVKETRGSKKFGGSQRTQEFLEEYRGKAKGLVGSL